MLLINQLIGMGKGSEINLIKALERVGNLEKDTSAAINATGTAHVNATITTLLINTPLRTVCDNLVTSKFCQRMSSGKLAPFAFTLIMQSARDYFVLQNE